MYTYVPLLRLLCGTWPAKQEHVGPVARSQALSVSGLGFRV